MPKAAVQYIENHDHERFLCNFGLSNPDEAGNSLFAEGDRSSWYRVQPYLIGLLLSKGVPLLWQGQEFGENYFLPDFGAGRVSILRPLRWDYFYDEAGRAPGALSANFCGSGVTAAVASRPIFLLQPMGAISFQGMLLFARYIQPILACRGEHERQRPDCTVLVSDRRWLRGRASR